MSRLQEPTPPHPPSQVGRRNLVWMHVCWWTLPLHTGASELSTYLHTKTCPPFSLQIYAALFGLGVGVYKVHVDVHYITMFMFAQYVKNIMNFINTSITPLPPKGQLVECVLSEMAAWNNIYWPPLAVHYVKVPDKPWQLFLGMWGKYQVFGYFISAGTSKCARHKL